MATKQKERTAVDVLTLETEKLTKLQQMQREADAERGRIESEIRDRREGRGSGSAELVERLLSGEPLDGDSDPQTRLDAVDARQRALAIAVDEQRRAVRAAETEASRELGRERKPAYAENRRRAAELVTELIELEEAGESMLYELRTATGSEAWAQECPPCPVRFARATADGDTPAHHWLDEIERHGYTKKARK